MNYLISAFDCVGLGENKKILKNVKYEFEFSTNGCDLICDNDSNLIPFCDGIKNLARVKYKSNNYYFLLPVSTGTEYVYCLSYNSKQIVIQLSNCLKISIDGKTLCDVMVSKIAFSHYEIENDVAFIYFSGDRNFVAVIKEGEICFSGYYDECNINENEKYFLMKMNDCLNHGKVCHVKKKEVETYLVYLDDYDLNMKNEFVGCVFLDCVIAKNLKYANQILSKDIRMKKEGEINSFFPNFDNYFLIEDNVAVVKYDYATYGLYNDEFIVGSLVNIKDANLARDFVARAYVLVDGVYYYSDATCVRNIAQIADSYINTSGSGYEELDADIKELVDVWAKAND